MRCGDAERALEIPTRTTGYTVAHNVMVNTPGLLTAPNAGNNLLNDNGPNISGAEDTMTTAGIEPAYVDIKNLAVPVAAF